MQNTNNTKRKQIIEAALKRFSHFGVNKTTMNEIAMDVSFSKANLYYYFPDKTALVIGVFQELVNNINDQFYRELDHKKTVLEAINLLLKIRKEYFNKHYLLHMTLEHADSNVDIDRLKDLAKWAEKQQVDHLKYIFEQAIKNKELVTFDTLNTSNIYLSIIQGIGIECMHFEKNKDIPDISMFEEILNKQLKATTIFINGLRHPLIAI